MSVSDVLEKLAVIGETKGFNLKAGIKLPVAHQPPPPCRPPVPPQIAPVSPQPPRRPPPPSPNSQQRHVSSTSHPTHSQQNALTAASSHPPMPGLFSSIKGGAGSLFKNLKVVFISLNCQIFRLQSSVAEIFICSVFFLSTRFRLPCG